jgi:hypothetical protein
MSFRSWLLSGLFLTVLACHVQAQEGYSYIAGHTAYSSNGETSRGFVDAQLMCHDSKPIICYGAQKRPADKGRFTYIILFAPDAPKSGFGCDFSGKTDGDAADVSATIKLKQFEVAVDYAYTTDEKTGELKSEKLSINGKETPTDPPQVYLAVREGEKTTLKPVKVKVTTVPPVIGAEDKNTHPFYLQQTIDALKKESPEIAEFLKKK